MENTFEKELRTILDWRTKRNYPSLMFLFWTIIVIGMVIEYYINNTLYSCFVVYFSAVKFIFIYRKKIREETSLIVKLTTEIKNTQLRYKELHDINEQILKDRTTILKVIAHDLRTPLQGSIGCAEIIENDNDLPPRTRDIAKVIKNTSIETHQLFEDLLNYALYETSKVEIIKTPLNLKECFNEIVNSQTSFLMHKKQNVELQISEKLLWLTNKTMIDCIMRNLLTNAIKNGPEGQTITITANKMNDGLQIKVKDQGRGMHEESRKKIFERFKYETVCGLVGEDSMGVGLSLVNNYVKRLQGEILVKRGEPNGCVFVVNFKNIK